MKAAAVFLAALAAFALLASADAAPTLGDPDEDMPAEVPSGEPRQDKEEEQ